MIRTALIAAIALPSAMSIAQDARPRILGIEFGWTGMSREAGHVPIRIAVDGGSGGFSGSVTIDIFGTAGRGVAGASPWVISASAAATPGVTSTIMCVSPIKSAPAAMRVRLFDDAGQQVDRRVVSAIPGEGELALNAATLSLGPLIAFAGTDRAPELGEAPEGAEQPSPGEITTIAAPIESLPAIPAAYDAIDALVVDAEGSRLCAPDSLAAVQAWVWSGGTLVVVAAAPGDAWRAWLPPDSEGDAVTLADAQRMPAPPEVSGDRVEIQCRPISLTLDGVRRGWERWWWTGETSALLAAGPVGLGRVVVVGLDPARAGAVLSSAHEKTVWRAALEPVRPSLSEPETPWNRVADEAMLDAVVLDVQPVRTGLIVVGALGVLALLLGPMDYVLMRLRGPRHRSHATALGWIGLACAGAIVAPRIIRAGPSESVTASVYNLVSGDSGSRGSRLTTHGLSSSRSATPSIERQIPGSWFEPAAFSLREDVPVRFAARHGGGPEAVSAPLLRGLAPFTTDAYRETAPALVDIRATVDRLTDGYSVTVHGLDGARVISAAVRDNAGWRTAQISGSAAGNSFVASGVPVAGEPSWMAAPISAPTSAEQVAMNGRRTSPSLLAQDSFDARIRAEGWVMVEMLVDDLAPPTQLRFPGAVERHIALVRLCVPRGGEEESPHD